jgi:hypothetical protein
MTASEILGRLRDELELKGFFITNIWRSGGYDPNAYESFYKGIEITWIYPTENLVTCYLGVRIKDIYHSFYGEEIDINFADKLLRHIDVYLAASRIKKPIDGKLNDLFGVENG